MEEAPWSKTTPPFFTPPFYPNRFAFDVFYDRRAYPGGSVFRCHLEIRRPAVIRSSVATTVAPTLNSETFRLGLCTFQFIGVLTAAKPEYVDQLQYVGTTHRHNGTGDAHNIDEKKFYTSLLHDAEQALLNGKSARTHHVSPVKQASPTGKEATDSSPVYTFPDLCYSAAVEKNSIVFLKSFPQCICANEVFSAESSSSSDARGRESATFGFECLLPPSLPPSFSGIAFRYSYYISVVISRDFPAINEKLTHVLLPVTILGPEYFGLHFILDPQFLDKDKTPEPHRPRDTALIRLFDFCSLAWRGGNSIVQYKRHTGIRPSTIVPHTLHVVGNRIDGPSYSYVEVLNLLQWMATKHSQNKGIEGLESRIPASLIDGSRNEDNDDIEHFEPGRWSLGETFRLSHKSDLITVVQLMGPTIGFIQRSSPAFPYTKLTHPLHIVHCCLGTSIVANFDFSTATREVFELHAFLIKEESVRQATSHSAFRLFQPQEGQQTRSSGIYTSPPDTPLHRSIVWEQKHVVAHQLYHSMIIDISPTLTPSFSTNLVKLNYFLLFRVFCQPPPPSPRSSSDMSDSAVRDHVKAANAEHTPLLWMDVGKGTQVMEMYWTVGVVVTHQTQLEGTEGPLCDHIYTTPASNDKQQQCRNAGHREIVGVFSPLEDIWELGEGHKRIYRGFLV